MRRTAAVLAVLGLGAAAFAAPAGAAKIGDRGGKPLVAELSGAQEVPGPADPDGSGSALVTVNHGRGEVCWRLEVADIAPAAAAHIHAAPAGMNGPVVVGLTPPTEGSSEGCESISRDLAKALIQQPEQYYVNVHNAEFPPGAVRGQLG